jgi:hypothetical protein
LGQTFRRYVAHSPLPAQLWFTERQGFLFTEKTQQEWKFALVLRTQGRNEHQPVNVVGNGALVRRAKRIVPMGGRHGGYRLTDAAIENPPS